MNCPICDNEMSIVCYGGYWFYECPECGALEDMK